MPRGRYPIKSIPSDLLEKIFRMSKDLHDTGLDEKEIIKAVFEKYRFRLNRSTLYRWTKGMNNPLSNMNHFSLRPSPELSYVIGVFLGDGSIRKKPRDYKRILRLTVNDLEFAENFSSKLAKLLGKARSYAVTRHQDISRGGATRYSVEASCKPLHEFLKQDTEKILGYVNPHVSDFMTGLFDSDGFTSICASKKFSVGAGLASTDTELLNFVKENLRVRFDIRSSIATSMKRGERVKIWGTEYTANKDVKILSINGTKGTERFSRLIGFSFSRKQRKILDAIDAKKNFRNMEAIETWKRSYQKQGREWVARSEKVDSGGSPGASF